MTTSATKTEPDRASLSWRFLRPIPTRLRDRRFWLIQLMLTAITGFHIAGEASGVAEHYGSMRHFPVMLYVIPVVYAALWFGIEGGLLTSLWSLVLSAPNITLWHKGELEGEIGLLALVFAIGLILAWRVEREGTLRREAEAVSQELQYSKERLQFYLREITDAQEAERQRVARELHDDTIQSLVLVGRTLDTLLQETTEPAGDDARQQAESARTQVDAIIDGVRRMARDLRPSILDRLGLVPSIEWLLNDLGQRQNLKSQFDVDGEIQRMAPEVELSIFRVVQEALKNVELHADANSVQVTLTASDGRLTLCVHDDGQGFRLSEVSHNDRHSGLGLLGMQERAKLLGGTVEITSAPDEGTTILASIPADSRS